VNKKSGRAGIPEESADETGAAECLAGRLPARPFFELFAPRKTAIRIENETGGYLFGFFGDVLIQTDLDPLETAAIAQEDAEIGAGTLAGTDPDASASRDAVSSDLPVRPRTFWKEAFADAGACIFAKHRAAPAVSLRKRRAPPAEVA